MEMKHDGVCLPDTAKCKADEGGRSPLDIQICPMGYSECNGDCFYYTE